MGEMGLFHLRPGAGELGLFHLRPGASDMGPLHARTGVRRLVGHQTVDAVEGSGPRQAVLLLKAVQPDPGLLVHPAGDPALEKAFRLQAELDLPDLSLRRGVPDLGCGALRLLRRRRCLHIARRGRALRAAPGHAALLISGQAALLFDGAVGLSGDSQAGSQRDGDHGS